MMLGRKMVGRSSRAVVAAALASAMTLGLAGCGGSSSSDTETIIMSTSTIQMEKGADNRMCNNGLKLTVLDVQKRPLSTFSGASVLYDSSDSSGANEMSSAYIAIQVDMKVAFNASNFQQATSSAGGDEDAPTVLSDILIPGSLIFVRGTDSITGGSYTSYSIIQPETQTDVNGLMLTGSSWNYNLISTVLPEASEERQGSIVFKVAAQATDLQLVIVTANGNSDPLDEDSVLSGNNQIYIYDIDSPE